MPKYDVQLVRKTTEDCWVSVYAPDEEAARKKAYQGAIMVSPTDWDNTYDEYLITACREIDDA